MPAVSAQPQPGFVATSMSANAKLLSLSGAYETARVWSGRRQDALRRVARWNLPGLQGGNNYECFRRVATLNCATLDRRYAPYSFE